MWMMLAAALVGSAPVSERSPRQVVEAMFEAFNRHEAETMANLYAPDAILSSSDFCTPRGQKDVVRTYRSLFEAFPDIVDEVETMIVEGDRVAVRFTARSDIGRFRMPIMAVVRVRDGLIVSDDAVFDTGGRPCTP